MNTSRATTAKLAHQWRYHPLLETLEDRITPSNTPPVGVADYYAVTYGQTLNVGMDISDPPGVLDNDYDAESDPLTAELYSWASYGYLDLNSDGSFTYTPYMGHPGSDSFEYRAYDGEYYSDPVTVSITINPDAQAYPNYLAAVAQANQDFDDAVAAALQTYETTFAALVSAAQSQAAAAYQDYLSALPPEYQDYVSIQATAFEEFLDALEQADTTARTDRDQAITDYYDAIGYAEINLVANRSAALADYQDALAAADAAYATYVGPYQQARDAAYAYFLANPEDPQAEMDYLQAEDDLAAAITYAEYERGMAYDTALTEYGDALDTAFQEWNVAAQSALDAFNTAWDNIQTDWEMADQAAHYLYDITESDAWYYFVSAEMMAWSEYVGFVQSIQTNLDSAVGSAQSQYEMDVYAALSGWYAAEDDAWYAYLDAIGGGTPGARADAPSLPSEPLESAPTLGIGQQDPENFVAEGRFEFVGANTDLIGDLNDLSLEIDVLLQFILTHEDDVHDLLDELIAALRGMINALEAEMLVSDPDNEDAFDENREDFESKVIELILMLRTENEQLEVNIHEAAELIFDKGDEAFELAQWDFFRIKGIFSDLYELREVFKDWSVRLDQILVGYQYLDLAGLDWLLDELGSAAPQDSYFHWDAGFLVASYFQLADENVDLAVRAALIDDAYIDVGATLPAPDADDRVIEYLNRRSTMIDHLFHNQNIWSGVLNPIAQMEILVDQMWVALGGRPDPNNPNAPPQGPTNEQDFHDAMESYLIRTATLSYNLGGPVFRTINTIFSTADQALNQMNAVDSDTFRYKGLTDDLYMLKWFFDFELDPWEPDGWNPNRVWGVFQRLEWLEDELRALDNRVGVVFGDENNNYTYPPFHPVDSCFLNMDAILTSVENTRDAIQDRIDQV